MKRLPKSLLFLLPLAALIGIGFFAFRQYAAPDPLAGIAHANGRLEFDYEIGRASCRERV